MHIDNHSSPAITYDPIQVEVWRHLFASIAEEMGATLERTAFSPNIKERLDHSCALFDAEGRLLAQAAHIPVHLGAMPLMMQTLHSQLRWPKGSMWICNDPRHGGTHLPDWTLVGPVYHENQLIGFVANRAHHADIGGMAPGSMPLSTEIYQEGILIPPVQLVVRNRMQPDLVAILCANSRTPDERLGDLSAQVAANRVGARRLQELVARFGNQTVRLRAIEANGYSREVVRAMLAAAPEGIYSAVDYLEDDGQGRFDLPIQVAVTIRGGTIRFDFSGTSPESSGSVNASEAVTRSACYYMVRCLIGEEIPMNAGAFEEVQVDAPSGTLANARFPRAVAAGNVETSQRIVDLLLQALAPAFPDRIPACSQGTMNNLTIGGTDPRTGRAFAYYETICGGAGAGPGSPGADAVHTHMTNTRNTPIEALEMHFPLRVRRYSIRAGSGGAGNFCGGRGVIREVELLADAQVTLQTERRRRSTPGLAGGENGAPGRNLLTRPGEAPELLPAKYSGFCRTGTTITVETPGGGGWGREG